VKKNTVIGSMILPMHISLWNNNNYNNEDTDGSRQYRDGWGFKGWCSIPAGDFGAFQNLVQCLTTGTQKITMTDLAYEQNTDSLFLIYSYNTTEILFLF